MSDMRFVKTVGELRSALDGLDDLQPVGISYSEEGGPGDTLVVLSAPGGTDVRWVGIDYIPTDKLTKE